MTLTKDRQYKDFNSTRNSIDTLILLVRLLTLQTLLANQQYFDLSTNDWLIRCSISLHFWLTGALRVLHLIFTFSVIFSSHGG